MPSPSAKPQSRQRSAGSGYEKRDANAKWIFGIIGFLIFAGLIMHFCVAGMMGRFERKPTTIDRWTGARQAAGISADRASVPHLQMEEAKDLKKFRAREDEELDSYGWIDRTAGVVRIPVERAMGLLLERGFPVRSETNAERLGASAYQLQQERPNYPQPEIQGDK